MPPSSLPAGYLPIWRALAEAEAQAGSRQALARQLGVATQTLQRVLVRGDVPAFPETRNARVRRSWVRTLARLARRLGGDPRQWLEQVGIPWDEEARSIVGDSGTTGSPGTVPTGPAGPGEALPDCIEIGLAAAGLADLPVFQPEVARRDTAPSAPTGPAAWSFGETFARVLFGAVHPEVTLRFHRVPEVRLAEAVLTGAPARLPIAVPMQRAAGRPSAADPPDALPRPRGAIDCALGLLATADRELRGAVFLPIPGWSVALSAIGVAAPSGASPTEFPRWPAAVFTPAPEAPPLMVVDNSVAHRHLRGVCGVPADRLQPLSHDHAQVTRALREAAEKAGGRTVLFVEDELICRRLAAELEQVSGLRVREIAGSIEWAPRFPLALALMPHARHWKDALVAALEREAFGASERYVGRLYGELLAGAALPAILADPFAPLPPGAAPRLQEFPLASAAFLDALVAQLVSAIEGPIVRHVGQGPERRWAALLAAGHARTLLPDAWRTALARLPELLPEVAGPHCQSCSVTLDEHHALETTDRYCRFCSEPDGHLKSRAEVRRLIGGWFANWQRGVPPEEAQRRAEFFMRSMPAWTGN